MALQHELTRERNERFLRLLEPIHSDCERWAYSLTRNVADAEDILSQAIVIGLERIHQLKTEGAFKTWMFRIIRTSHLLWIRSGKHAPETVAPEDIDRDSRRDDSWAERNEQRELVWQVIGKLSPEQREALVLFELEGFSIRDVSQVLGKKESAVRVLLHRARQRLRNLLEKEGISGVS